MTFWILTLFPQIFENVFSQSILKNAQDKKLVKVRTVNIRNFATDKHKTVDDKPYGGGKGMVLKVDVVVKALESIKPKPYSILLSASGITYNQKTARLLSAKKSLALICGHYEGIDARVENFVDEVISIGNFVLTGGEIPAMAIVDSVARLIPGVIHPESLKYESFTDFNSKNWGANSGSPKHQLWGNKTGSPKHQLWGDLEYPQYTRPPDFRGLKVPPVLISGNHQEITKWRKRQSSKRTQKFRS